ncbi:DNA repair protein RecO [Legionella beliardensis]|uniref:DNA repair protein RecO n=1 Tax=Legionella beliardensis TaxID=91822 RepID=A0A378I2B7_9GAMM|nr:DNA repair protein RecO C-terminal domain-containing protein [Legionella beliardensis]STX29337.1 DNA repair protein RecO [Legionella beliardensis]
MTDNSLNAWLLHKQPLGDTSLKAIFYTREQGIIPCVYKGGRLPKKQTLLQPFIPLWLSVRHQKNSQWCYVSQIENTGPSLILNGDSLFAGLYINELIYYLLADSEPSTLFYDSYELTLKALAQTQARLELEAILRYFEYRLLQLCGYAFSYTHEAYSYQLIDLKKHYTFIAGHGFVPAHQGLLGSDILALGQGQLNTPHLLKLAKHIMRQAINHALDGRALISRNLFKMRTSFKH